MKTKNALTVRPDPGLAELKRARNLIRITSKILAKPVALARNRTDEQGRKQGRWTETEFPYEMAEGDYIDSKRHGHWAGRFADGQLDEGPFVDGKRHGHWSERWTDGRVWEGHYVDGEMHGRWVWRKANGEVMSETCWENGKQVNC